MQGFFSRMYPWLHSGLLSCGEGLLVVHSGVITAEVAGEVAEDLARWPQAYHSAFGAQWPGSVREERLVGGFGSFAVVDEDAEHAADAGQEQPEGVSQDRVRSLRHLAGFGEPTGGGEGDRVHLCHSSGQAPPLRHRRKAVRSAR